MAITPILAAALAMLAAGQLPTSTPAGPAREYGMAAGGVAGGLVADGWRFQGPMKVELALKNVGANAVTLPAREKLFIYLLVAQGKTVHFTERLYPAKAMQHWPGRLESGQELVLDAVDAADAAAFEYKPGLKIVQGFPAELVDGKPSALKPAGKLADTVQIGAVKIKAMAYLDRDAEGSLSVEAKAVALTVAVGDFARLSPAAQGQLLDDLRRRFLLDAFSAQRAEGDAVRVGPAALPTLVQIIKDARAADFARMWAATGVADIGTDAAVGTLTDCLTDASSGVRGVAAYHGLKLNNAKFDEALLARALKGDDTTVTSWAIMGFLKHRKDVPATLMQAGVDSKDWKVRAAVVETISKGNPNKSHLPILEKLAQDENPQIRKAAQDAIKYVRGAASAPTK